MIEKKVLAIGGTDPTCGAGVQLDAFTIARLGAFPYTVITAVVAQNSAGVLGSRPIAIDLLEAQLDAVLRDGPIDAIKTGMLPSAEALSLVADFAKKTGAPLVVDPVLAASDGTPLFEGDLEAYIKLLTEATVVTPNAPEAEILTGSPVRDEMEMLSAARALLEMGARAALVKGGHVEGPEATDLLMDNSETPIWFRQPKRPVKKVRGTGCMLASAIAVSITREAGLPLAVKRAKNFVTNSIETAATVGSNNRQAIFFLTDLMY